MNVKKHMGRWVLGLFALAGVAGCEGDPTGVMQGVNVGAHVDPSTAEFRVEAELIPNASLAKEDTSPDWPMGRYAFTNGADRVLVVSRITSYAEVDPKTEKPTGRRIDANKERAWITIPFDFPKGMPLSVEAQEAKFQVGYDKTPGKPVVDNIIDLANMDEYFIDPNAIRGKITVEDEGVNSASIHINIDVSPQRYPRWRWDKVMDVPITTVGIWARRARPELIMASGGRLIAPPVPDTQPSETADTKPSTDTVLVPATQPLRHVQGNTTAWPDEATHQPANPNTAKPAIGLNTPATQPTAKSIAGRWICPRTPSDNFEYRFQFDANGNCVFTSQRPTYPPVPRYGTWEMKHDFVVINVQRAEPGVLAYPYVTLRLSWQGNTPVLSGDLLPQPWFQNRVLILQQGNFMDMNAVLPKAE